LGAGEDRRSRQLRPFDTLRVRQPRPSTKPCPTHWK
jgi:hypothetical protein